MERLGCLYLTFLNHPQGLSFEKIRNQLAPAYAGEPESARRKFERDKEDLRQIGMDLEHFADGQALPGGGMARGHVYIPGSDLEKLPDLKLTSTETSTLATLLLYALDHAANERQRELLRSSASKLLFRTPMLLRDGSSVREFWTPDKSEPDEQLALVRRAIQKRIVLELEYPDRGGGSAVRKVRPRGLISHRGRWCLVCHTDSQSVRYFYADRIISLKATRTHFPQDPGFHIKEHSLHPLLLKIHAPEQILLRAHPDHMDSVLDFTSGLPSLKIEGPRIAFRTTNKAAVFSFILRHPGSVEQIGPDDVYNAMIRYQQETLELYK